MKITALIVAAGKGRRMGSAVGKQFLPLGGRAILAHTLIAFDQTVIVDQIMVVLPAGGVGYCQDNIIDHLSLKKKIELVAGGAHRQDSVYKGLCKIGAEGEDGIVLIHDGVRPFIQPERIAETIVTARDVGACILAVPVADTLKKADQNDQIRSTLDRKSIWMAQTPQTFRFPVIWQAHKAARKDGYLGTDDAQLVERLKKPVAILSGSRYNIKITTPEDLEMAEMILAAGGLK